MGKIIARLLNEIKGKLKRNTFILIIFLASFVYVLFLIIIMLYSRLDFFSALIFLLPSFMGSLASIGKSLPDFARLICLFMYILILGAIISKISEKIIVYALRGGIIMSRVKYKNHLVICGWNYQAPTIIEQLLSTDIYSKRQIVILADFDEVPYKSDKIVYVKGVSWKKDDLVRAGIPTADTAIVLSDLNGKSANPDGDSLLTVLAIETLNRNVYTCVQILSSQNKEHLQNAGSDEIICLDEFGGTLLVSSALNHGISKIISELLNFNVGSEIYKYKKPVPDKFIDRTFVEVAKELMNKEMILIAVETARDEYSSKFSSKTFLKVIGEKVLILNPPRNFKIRKGDFLFIIAQKEPHEL